MTQPTDVLFVVGVREFWFAQYNYALLTYLFVPVPACCLGTLHAAVFVWLNITCGWSGRMCLGFQCLSCSWMLDIQADGCFVLQMHRRNQNVCRFPQQTIMMMPGNAYIYFLNMLFVLDIGRSVYHFLQYIYTFQRDTQCCSTDCLLMHRCQLYMFWTVTVHPQELLFRCCMCRLWYNIPYMQS